MENEVSFRLHIGFHWMNLTATSHVTLQACATNDANFVAIGQKQKTLIWTTCIFSAVSRLPFSGFSWIFIPHSFDTCAKYDV